MEKKNLTVIRNELAAICQEVSELINKINNTSTKEAKD